MTLFKLSASRRCGVFLLALCMMCCASFVQAQVSPLTDVVQTAASATHVCALDSAGGVKCWGNNRFGQLGDGSTTHRYLPVAVSGLSGGVRAISTGSAHMCALMDTGGVKCWGGNQFGQLGDGSTVDRWVPVDVLGLSSGVQAISVGLYFTCALTDAGAIKCWGYNGTGQLGDGSTTGRLVPGDVLTLPAGMRAIHADQGYACALTAQGGVKCWGENSFGQLGFSSSWDEPVFRTLPADVPSLASGVQAVSLGWRHACALTDAGGVKCWGDDSDGQLGNDAGMGASGPVDVVTLGSGVQAISVASAGDHSCALTASGEVKCWGLNRFSQLGDGTVVSRHAPVSVVGLGAGVSGIHAAGEHTCARMVDGTLKCWGLNLNGQLGDGTSTARRSPVALPDLLAGVQSISAGGYHSCALSQSGGVSCWGNNAQGQLGNGEVDSQRSPVPVTGLSEGVRSISAGSLHTCAVTRQGGAQCWGNNASRQLGDGTQINRSLPVDVLGLDSDVQTIAAGYTHNCVLMPSGSAKCWGSNGYGQLGTGMTDGQHVGAVDVSVLQAPLQSIVVGDGFSCGLTRSGGVKCWGLNMTGQLGDGRTALQHALPVNALGLESGVQAISAGRFHVCALLETGGVKCWGSNYYGEVGDGSVVDRYSPVDVVGLQSGVQGISAKGSHTCAVLSGHQVKCWGQNTQGQLGNEQTEHRSIPVDVVGFTRDIQTLSAGGEHSCALDDAGGVACWGNNLSGQVGDGSRLHRAIPQPVLQSVHPVYVIAPPNVSLLEDGEWVDVLITDDLAGLASDVVLSFSSSDPALVDGAVLAADQQMAGNRRVLRIRPAADASGMATLTVTARNGRGDEASANIDLTVLPVNDAPNFTLRQPYVGVTTSAPNLRLEGDWIQSFSLGPVNESDQGFSFSVTGISDPNQIISTHVLSEDGQRFEAGLTGATGSAAFQITLTDDGGTDHGGVDSKTQTLIVAVGDGGSLVGLRVRRDCAADCARTAGMPASYEIEIFNGGPLPVVDLPLQVSRLVGLEDIVWACAEPEFCAPDSGVNAVATRLDIPVQTSALIRIDGRVAAPEQGTEIEVHLDEVIPGSLLPGSNRYQYFQDPSDPGHIFRARFE